MQEGEKERERERERERETENETITFCAVKYCLMGLVPTNQNPKMQFRIKKVLLTTIAPLQLKTLNHFFG